MAQVYYIMSGPVFTLFGGILVKSESTHINIKLTLHIHSYRSHAFHGGSLN